MMKCLTLSLVLALILVECYETLPVQKASRHARDLRKLFKNEDFYPALEDALNRANNPNLLGNSGRKKRSVHDPESRETRSVAAREKRHDYPGRQPGDLTFDPKTYVLDALHIQHDNEGRRKRSVHDPESRETRSVTAREKRHGYPGRQPGDLTFDPKIYVLDALHINHKDNSGRRKRSVHDPESRETRSVAAREKRDDYPRRQPGDLTFDPKTYVLEALHLHHYQEDNGRRKRSLAEKFKNEDFYGSLTSALDKASSASGRK